MPQILSTIEDALLPGVFRRRRLGPRTPAPIIGNDLPEQGGFSGNMPRPNLLQRGDIPLTTLDETPNMPAPQPNVLADVAATRPRTTMPVAGEVPADTSMRPARRVETDTRGRPTRNITLEGDEQTLDYANRVSRYEPQAGGGGWWPKIRAAIAGFAAGGPVGAATAVGTRALREKFQPKLADEEWKAEQMGKIAPSVETIRQARKDKLAERSTEANIDLAKARTEELKNRKEKEKWIIKQDEHGIYRPVNQATGLDPDGKPVKGRLASNEWELKINDQGRFVPVNKRTGLDQNGKPVTARAMAGKTEEDVGFHNAQIERSIREAQAEQAKIDTTFNDPNHPIPLTIEATDILTGTTRKVPNPEYTYIMNRRRQLDDQIRRWRTQLKSPKKGASASTSPEDRLNLLFDEEDEEP